MNVIRKYVYMLCALVPMALAAQTTYTDVDREFRATWLTTVWQIDWPQTQGEVNQKREIDVLLNRIEDVGLNACFFQVRTMCDAFYDSAYEPWSKWMTGTRGQAPTYDPFAYIIEQAHARGIEVHAWINPYRYSTGASTYSTTCENDYAVAHPDWLLQCGDGYVLNPGMPEVRQRICDVVTDIMQKYDVDGFVFDDYFYQSGVTNEGDQAQYDAYNPHNLSRGDWRRAQVDSMVADVNRTIKSIRPWVRFGIGPAGQAASDQAVADKYGVTPCPSSDWQYSQIYSDPLAWLSARDIDYISPQIYWAIGTHGSDYALLSPWWYMVANKFGRHCYVSSTLSYLTTKNATEYVNQIEINRTSTLENAPGMVYFSAKQLKTTNFASTLCSTVNLRKVLPPAMSWYKAPEQGMVGDLTRTGSQLSWTYAQDSLRYAVYAMSQAERNALTPENLHLYYIGMTYARAYDLPSTVGTTDAVAVAVVDRYGNVYALRFVGESEVASASVTLVSPADGADIMLPTLLRWNVVAGATGYQVEIAHDAQFNDLLMQKYVSTNELSTQACADVDGTGIYYWRVKPLVANATSAWSETRSFSGHLFSILSPETGSVDVSEAPLITWDDAGVGATYELEIAQSTSFINSVIKYRVTTNEPWVQVPAGVLNYSATYYARVKVETATFSSVSAVISFTTEAAVAPVPTIESPTNGQTVYNAGFEVILERTVNNGFRVELCANASFPTRQTKVKTISVGSYSCTYTDIDPGDYYLRAKAVGADGYTDYCEPIQIHVAEGTGVEDVDANAADVKKTIINGQVTIHRNGKKYTILGIEL